MISQYERIRVFRSSSLLYSVHVKVGSWIYRIHFVSINFWLTCVYFLRGKCFSHSLWMLVGIIFVLISSPLFGGGVVFIGISTQQGTLTVGFKDFVTHL
jgi:hypothetical protein